MSIEEIFENSLNLDINKFKYLENDILNLFNNEIFNKNTVDSNMMIMIGIYYYNIKKDYDLMKKYFLMAIELNQNKAINDLENCLNNPLQLYCELIKFNKHELIDKKIKELKNNRQVNNYLNKCKFSEKYNVIEYCFICLEDNKLSITIDNCCHTVCKECYCKLNKCPLCK
jgi:hypothetical protein